LLCFALIIEHVCILNKNGITWRNAGLARLVRSRKRLSGGSANTIKDSRCFLVLKYLPVLLRTGWFQERIRERFNNQIKKYELTMRDYIGSFVK